MKIQVIDNEENIKFKPVDWRDIFFDSNFELESECGKHTTTMNDIRCNIEDFTITEVESSPKACEHNYEIVDKKYKSSYNGFSTNYERITTYFCKKCLDEQTKVKTESQRGTPDWFMSNNA